MREFEDKELTRGNFPLSNKHLEEFYRRDVKKISDIIKIPLSEAYRFLGSKMIGNLIEAGAVFGQEEFPEETYLYHEKFDLREPILRTFISEGIIRLDDFKRFKKEYIIHITNNTFISNFEAKHGIIFRKDDEEILSGEPGYGLQKLSIIPGITEEMLKALKVFKFVTFGDAMSRKTVMVKTPTLAEARGIIFDYLKI